MFLEANPRKDGTTDVRVCACVCVCVCVCVMFLQGKRSQKCKINVYRS